MKIEERWLRFINTSVYTFFGKNICRNSTWRTIHLYDNKGYARYCFKCVYELALDREVGD